MLLCLLSTDLNDFIIKTKNKNKWTKHVTEKEKKRKRAKAAMTSGRQEEIMKKGK